MKIDKKIKQNMMRINIIIFAILICLLCYNCKNGNKVSTEGSKSTTATKEKLSISQVLRENSHLNVREQVTLYHNLKKDSLDVYNFGNEDELTMYGYSFLWEDKVKDAIEIFKLIVEQFPNSSNPYDSLGEAYLADGQDQIALANYEKSLELDPENFNAEDQIERLKYPDKKEETAVEKFLKVLTEKEYKDDLDQMGRKLIEVHPNVFKFISKEDFWKIIEEKKSLITENTTYGDFIWHCSEIIASIGCSHSSLNGFYQESEMLDKSLVFPLQIRWVNERLFVVDPMGSAASIKPKDEITSINGKSVSILVNEIYRHIPSQANIETAKKHFFNSWSMEIIPYSLGFPESYTVQIKGKEEPIVLKKANTSMAPFNDRSIKRCSEILCLDFIDLKNTAILTISSFNFYPWNNLDFFKEFIDKSFKEIHEKGSENLIIDLRFNGGGSPESSIYLLKYLVDEPFVYFSETEYSISRESQGSFKNKFKGKLYFIIDGHGESTTGHFMAKVKSLNIGAIIGEELGSNQFCTAGQTVCRLRNSKMLFYVANTSSRVAVTSLPDDKGILPDYHVVQGIDDYLSHVDTVKEFTINLIPE